MKHFTQFSVNHYKIVLDFSLYYVYFFLRALSDCFTRGFVSHSLDPDSDPLCMLLLIDFLMLRSREYKPLLQLYQDWEVKLGLCVQHLIQ